MQGQNIYDLSETGENFHRIVSKPHSLLLEKIYYSHNLIIAEAIKKHFPRVKSIKALDIGGGSGELLKYFRSTLNDLSFDFTNVDRDRELLKQDAISDFKYDFRVQDIPKGLTWDLVLMRFALHYNSRSNQEEIIRKVNHLISKGGCFIIHHCAPVDKIHQEKLNELFSTPIVSQKLVRDNPYWSTWSEVSEMARSNGLEEYVLENYQIEIGDLYKVRYDLSGDEEARLHSFMRPYDFIDYTITKFTHKLENVFWP